jgi:hypothetical protein
MFVDKKTMIRYFWECVGVTLINLPTVKPNVVFYSGGDGIRNSGAREIKIILGEISKQTYECIRLQEDVPNVIHDNKSIEYDLIIPFINQSTTGYMNKNGIPLLSTELTIQNELAEIINNATDGLLRVVKRGCIDVPEEAKQYYNDYFRNVDQIGEFIRQCCVVHDNDAISTRLADLWLCYKVWSSEQSRYRTGYNDFSRELKARGFGYQKKGKVFFTGITLKHFVVG